MPTLTEQLQTNIRVITNTTGQYWEDWHALCTIAGIPAGQINERILAFYSTINPLSATFSSAYNYFLLNPSVVGAISAQITNLFSSGEQGAWYDPSDLSTLFQDSAGTTPVTASGQPVGLMRDKSGRGNHASQATAANRPVLQRESDGRYYLAFNGTNSWMSVASINFTVTDKMTVFTGFKKLVDVSGAIVELSVSADSNAGSFGVISSDPATDCYSIRVCQASPNRHRLQSYTSPILNVLSNKIDFALNSSINSSISRVNGADAGSDISSALPPGTGNFGTYPLYIGSRAGTSMFFNGNLYSLVIRGAASTATQIIYGESYANSRTAAY